MSTNIKTIQEVQRFEEIAIRAVERRLRINQQKRYGVHKDKIKDKQVYPYSGLYLTHHIERYGRQSSLVCA